MRNRFYTHPSDDIIVDVEHMYNVHDGIISVGVEDVHSVVSGADNVIVLTGKGTGNNRISNAIEDAVLRTCRVAVGYNLFSADKIIIKLIYPKSNPLMIDEIDGVTQFAEMFKRSTSFIWGISEGTVDLTDVLVQMIASNLKLQQTE